MFFQHKVFVSRQASFDHSGKYFDSFDQITCDWMFRLKTGNCIVCLDKKESVRNLNLQVQVHPGEHWISKQRVRIVLEVSKSAGAKGDVQKIAPVLTHSLDKE